MNYNIQDVFYQLFSYDLLWFYLGHTDVLTDITGSMMPSEPRINLNLLWTKKALHQVMTDIPLLIEFSPLSGDTWSPGPCARLCWSASAGQELPLLPSAGRAPERVLRCRADAHMARSHPGKLIQVNSNSSFKHFCISFVHSFILLVTENCLANYKPGSKNAERSV